MYCKHCGKEIDDNTQYCPYCGRDVSEPGRQDRYVESYDENIGVGWVILGLLFPVAGIIEYFAFKNTRPKTAQYCLIAGCVTFAINFLVTILL